MSDYYFLNECEELKRLIAENPDLPLMFFAEDTGNDTTYNYISCSSVTAHIGEVLDCPNILNNEVIFDEKGYFEEELQEMLCGIDEYRDLSDEEFDEVFKKEKSKYNDKWKDCIIVYVRN